MPNSIKLAAIASSAMAGVLLLAACGGGSSGATTRPPSPELTHVTVAAVPGIDDAGLYVAQEQGLFGLAGLSVTIDPVPGNPAAVAGLKSGKYAVAAGDSVSFVQEQVGHTADLELVG